MCCEPQRFPSTGKFPTSPGAYVRAGLDHPPSILTTHTSPTDTHLYSNARRHKEEARGAGLVLRTRSTRNTNANASLHPRIGAGPWPQAHRGAHVVHHYHHSRDQQQRRHHLRESHHSAQQARHHRALRSGLAIRPHARERRRCHHQAQVPLALLPCDGGQQPHPACDMCSMQDGTVLWTGTPNAGLEARA